jgi:sugar phosphate isomerase/epimerase
VSSLGWAHYTLYEALPRIAARGFTRVEIASFQSYCFHFNYGSPIPQELRAMLDERGLEPISLNFDAGFYKAWIPSEINRFVADWTRKIQQLGEVGIPMMTMSFGGRTNREDHQYQLHNELKAYDTVAEIGARYGVKMLLEVPHLYGNMPRTEQVLWMFERLQSSNIGALVDSSHWGIIGYDLRDFLDALGERLWQVHLRDSDGTDTADFKQQLELTPGAGSVDFRHFGQVLDSIGYHGDVTLDFEYRDLTLDAIEREFDRGLQQLEESGWELPDEVRRSPVVLT